MTKTIFKNARVTYQRMATALLHDMMHNEVEVYVDDMIVKSTDRGSHTINLRKFFERIKVGLWSNRWKVVRVTSE